MGITGLPPCPPNPRFYCQHSRFIADVLLKVRPLRVEGFRVVWEDGWSSWGIGIGRIPQHDVNNVYYLGLFFKKHIHMQGQMHLKAMCICANAKTYI